MSSLRVLALAISAMTLIPGYGAAQTVLDAVDSGNYTWEGEHGSANLNYLAGNPSGTYYELRDFFVFDLSSIAEPITSATLELYNPGNPPDPSNGFSSSDLTETLTLYEVTTPVATLVAGGMNLTAVFDDLGAGLIFGTVEVSAADNASLVRVQLTAEALQSLDASDGLWAIGGALTTMTGTRHEYIFGGTNGSMVRRLWINAIPVFWDGFESGTTVKWSSVVP